MTKKTKDPKLTPMMRQYFQIKNHHPDKYLFFRLGDFYEMFDQDAIEVSTMLQITLTERNQIPMCGIPHHQLHRYAHKVIAQGKKIVIVEQDEKPNPGSTLVTRKVSRIITPGTTIDEMNLSSQEKNFIISFYFSEEDKLFSEAGFSGLIALETTTGEVIFEVTTDTDDLKRSLKRFFENYSPTEAVLPESYRGKVRVDMLIKDYPDLIINYWPDPESLQVKEKVSFAYQDRDLTPEVSVPHSHALYQGLYLLLAYTEGNHGEKISYLQLPKEVEAGRFLILDQQTLIHLEIFKNNYDHTRKHSLLSVIDYTRTPMGSRKLQESLALPIRNRKEINKRLEQTEFFLYNPILLKEVRGNMAHIVDIERVSSRLALKRILPRDFLSLKRSLTLVKKVLTLLIEKKPEWVEEIHFHNSEDNKPARIINSLEGIVERIDATICEEPGNDLSKGDFIKPQAHLRLQEYFYTKTQSENLLSELEIREKKKSGIPNLRVRYNDNLGYFFETGKSNAAKVPPHFIRKQSLVSAERFVSEELLQLDVKIREARDHSTELEKEIFEELRSEMAKKITFFQEISSFIAHVDMVAGFAELAGVRRWCKPTLTESPILKIKDGRHPVVESEIDGPFIPNDIAIGSEEDIVQIITGPNMSGKSTFLRQNAIIVILAHLGSFVPASSAEVPLCDQVFTRIGSGDRLFQGESTFLVEMQETARILKQMTPNSLVIMDEIGRGTSTYDGLALAWSILEYINHYPDKKAKTLFATHYHELISLTQEKGITHYHVTIREEGDHIVFLKKVVQGVTSRSYGIQVARLAGLPDEVVDHAQALLEELEKKGEEVNPDEVNRRVKTIEKTKAESPPPAWEKDILNFDVSNHTPLETADFLSKIQKNILDKRKS